jgi:hypothetical protein
MQTQHVGLSSTRGWQNRSEDQYISSLSVAILTRMGRAECPRVKAAVRALREDLARGVADAYKWHNLSQVIADDDASAHSAIRAVMIAINRSQ